MSNIPIKPEPAPITFEDVPIKLESVPIKPESVPIKPEPGTEGTPNTRNNQNPGGKGKRRKSADDEEEEDRLPKIKKPPPLRDFYSCSGKFPSAHPATELPPHESIWKHDIPSWVDSVQEAIGVFDDVRYI